MQAHTQKSSQIKPSTEDTKIHAYIGKILSVKSTDQAFNKYHFSEIDESLHMQNSLLDGV